MDRLTHTALISRRSLLKAGGGALAAATVVPHLGAGTATAQTPKRGGTLSLRLWDPPHFDPHLTISYKINVLYTFTHSRLLKHKAGPGVTPGTFPIEGDLAESWTQPNETTYIFKLRKGVRWHNKPPVNGRELTADDVKYTFDRFVSEKGNANRAMMAALDKVEVVDKYTVKFTLKEPYVWFLDMVSNPMALAIIPKEAVEKFGDLKKPESVIGTGPWMLDSYRPNVGATFVRNPSYFLSGLPYIDKVEVTIDEDNASRTAAFIAGKYDLGFEASGTINRVGWVQIKDTLRQKRPKLVTQEFAANQMSHIYMRTDKPPFSDVRVRRAISLAFDRQGLLDMWSRVVYGARISVTVGFATIAIGTLVAAAVGISSAYVGGTYDIVVQRIVDAWMSFPYLVIILSLMAVLGPGLLNLILTLSLLIAAGGARVIRGAALSVMQNPYLEAARAMGSGHLRIVLRYVLPNVMATIMILATIGLGGVILAESSLPFLGFGVPPPYPSWGAMLSGSGRSYMYRAPWMAIWPGLAISLAVFGFNMLGDALRDVLDPRLRGSASTTR